MRSQIGSTLLEARGPEVRLELIATKPMHSGCRNVI
jgi:hypothetical protein